MRALFQSNLKYHVWIKQYTFRNAEKPSADCHHIPTVHLFLCCHAIWGSTICCCLTVCGLWSFIIQEEHWVYFTYFVLCFSWTPCPVLWREGRSWLFQALISARELKTSRPRSQWLEFPAVSSTADMKSRRGELYYYAATWMTYEMFLSFVVVTVLCLYLVG